MQPDRKAGKNYIKKGGRQRQTVPIGGTGGPAAPRFPQRTCNRVPCRKERKCGFYQLCTRYTTSGLIFARIAAGMISMWSSLGKLSTSHVSSPSSHAKIQPDPSNPDNGNKARGARPTTGVRDQRKPRTMATLHPTWYLVHGSGGKNANGTATDSTAVQVLKLNSLLPCA